MSNTVHECSMLHAHPCCYVWLYYSWFFVFDYICAVLHGSMLYNSCGLSAVKINEELLLLLLLSSSYQHTSIQNINSGRNEV